MVPQQSKNDSAMFSKQCGAKRLHKVQVDIVSGINERSKYRSDSDSGGFLRKNSVIKLY